MRKTLKILHTIAACGLIGGLGCYMVLLAIASPETPAAYAELRHAIAVISNYMLLPSLAVGLVTGLLSMVVHRPYMEKRWAWFKAALGILMFKGVLTIIGAKADHAAAVARRIADGEPAPQVLGSALTLEWYTLAAVMALSIANVVLGVWRPRLKRRSHLHTRHVAKTAPAADNVADQSERSRPAA